MLKIDYIESFVDDVELKKLVKRGEQISKEMEKENSRGNDYLGWLNLPSSTSKEEIIEIKEVAQLIRDKVNYLVVVGIGGSYLGSRAVIEALKSYFSKNSLEIIYAGHTLSSSYMAELLEFLKDKSYAINVISKSGTTTEPAIAFRLLKELLISQVGIIEANSRIFATTDKENGALCAMAKKNNYKSFIIPKNIGGRYSIFTPVGLLPIATAGFDIEKLVQGAKKAEIDLKISEYENNLAVLYAALRNYFYLNGKEIEILVSYEHNLVYLAEWYKQLFGESEGKNLKGIFPSSVNFSTDLHSMGQYIQDGRRSIFETIVHIDRALLDTVIPYDDENLDGINYLSGKTLDHVNKMAEKGTLKAHVDGSVPNIVISIDVINEYNLGYLLYFFEKSCAISGNLLGVNPFDQPGVEAYKKNMFTLLEKN